MPNPWLLSVSANWHSFKQLKTEITTLISYYSAVNNFPSVLCGFWCDLLETRDQDTVHCWVMLSWWPLAWSQVPPYPDVAIVTSIVTMPCSLLLTGPGLITDHLLNWDNITNVMITIWNIYRTRVIYWTGWQPRFHFR